MKNELGHFDRGVQQCSRITTHLALPQLPQLALAVSAMSNAGRTDSLNQMELLSLDPLEVTDVIYHSPCQDGFFAAVAFYHILKDSAKYHPVDAGKDAGVLSLGLCNRKIAMVDVAFGAETLQALTDAGNQVIVLDHHKSGLEKLAGKVEPTMAYFDMESSGAAIAWQFCIGYVPELVRYVEDRDLWRWKRPHSKQVNAGLALHMPTNFIYWAEHTLGMHSGSKGGELFNTLLTKGAAALDMEKLQVEEAVLRAHHGMLASPSHPFESLDVVSVNATTFRSEIANRLLALHPRIAVAMVYWFDGKRGGWHVSLRSRKDGEDVSKIARQFGGGGHAAAAGFFCEGNYPLFAIQKKSDDALLEEGSP